MKQSSDERQPPKKRDVDGLHRRRKIWYYSLTVNGRRQFFSTRTENYQEARKIRSKAEEDQKAGRLPTDLSKWLFEDLLQHVLEQRKLYLAINTVRLEKERSVQLLKFFAGMKVSRINATLVAKYQQQRAQQVSARTINLEIKVLRHVLKPARTWHAIQTDYKRLPEHSAGPGRSLEDWQARLLLDVAGSRPEWDAAFLASMVAGNTAMRGIEVKSLHIGDVDLIEREVHVTRSKTNAGLRNVPLNNAAVWAFTRLIERARALGSTDESHYLFPAFAYRRHGGERGNGYNPKAHQRSWRTAWRALLREAARRAGKQAAREAVESGKGWRQALAAYRRAAGVFKGWRFHDWRHHCISVLAEGNASDATLQSISGHLSKRMLEHYSHVRSEAKRRAIDSLPSYIPQQTPASQTPQENPSSKAIN